MYLDRPQSRWTAGAVGILAALAVVLNMVLVSCLGRGWGSSAAGGDEVQADGGARGGTEWRKGASVGEPDLRVRVLSGVERVSAACGAGLLVASGDMNPLLAAPAPGAGDGQALGQATTITIQDGSWVLTSPSGEQRRLPGALPLVLWPVTERSPVNVTSAEAGSGGAYLGRLRLVPRTDVSERALDVIEFVAMEDYLPGVVAKELPAGWPPQAYRVQAVCARTYAMQERQRTINQRAAGGEVSRCDVESSDHDQVYSGVTANGPAAEAVRSTRGQVLYWNGQLLRAYYSSTCGGRNSSARDTWPTGPGWEYNRAEPIQAEAGGVTTRDHACYGSPLYRWTVTRDRAELVKRFRKFGERNNREVRLLRDLGAIEAVAFNARGRPSRFRVVEAKVPGLSAPSGGVTWYELSGEELRLACNTDAPECAPIERKTRVSSSDLEVRFEGEGVVITGRGFGHGVGMCQYCAKGFAERGEDWRAMLARFYPGARVGSAY